MNFYKHHIGDYAAATAHLSWDEDMAYTRLLRWYYQHEKAIPDDRRAIYRLARASSKPQREAVDAVLDEFFSLEEDGWHQKRCDEELSRANAQAEANRRVAADREERRRKHREQSTNRADNANESSNESCSRAEHESFPSREPSQTPDSRHQTPDRKAGTPHTTGQAPDVGNPAGRLAAALNRAGVRVTSQDPRLIEAAEAGITAAEVIELRDLYPDKPAAYLLKAAASQRANGASGDTHGPRQPARRLSAVERVEANIERNRREREGAADPAAGDVLEGTAVRVAN
ncbi:YdaU family protein [Lysobacter soli]|uniref:YdaU family protein n=1 Tax=Lysobacter soli TaxID=453783 RepID=UPI0037CC9AD2